MKVRLEDLTHAYTSRGERRVAVRIPELDIESQSSLCLVGSSGSGKTTLLNILAGIVVPTSGRVYLGETNLFALNESERDRLRSKSIGCVFQTFNLLQGLSVLENLTLAQRFAGIPTAQARRRAHELLEMLNLLDRAQARPSELSVGEQQRVAIARAVSKAPSLVLADEPTASLDDRSAEAAIDLLIAHSSQCTLLVATHDARLLGRFRSVRSMSDLSGLS